MVLHNILRSQYQGQHGGQEPGDDEDDDVPGDCRLMVVLLVVVQTETLLEKPKDRGITSRTTLIMREQWPGKMAEYNSCCSNQSFSGLITSPFQD